MDVKKIINDMLAKGMTEDQVVATLEEMGVADARALFDEATERLKTVDLAEEAPAGEGEAEGAEEAEGPAPRPALKPAKAVAEGEEAGEAEEAGAGEAEEGVPRPVGTRGGAGGVDEKLEEVLALLKALQEINKKILETDRSVLLRLREKTSA